ncbi:MAG TPA: hypothetical protein VI997_02320 [Candidatus Thermoplasmatota archaeon]|nr:hypothetical protein [Candidatus Thermoplasmatota archaeon]
MALGDMLGPLDPKDAEIGAMLVLAGVLTVVLLGASYGIAWLWHRFRDKAGA